MSRANRVSKLSVLLLATGFLMAINACDNRQEFAKYNVIEVDGWDKSQVSIFDVPPIKVSGDYNQMIGVRITADYPFLTLSIIVDQTVFPSLKTTTDTLNCVVIDESGKHLGQGQNLWQQTFFLKRSTLQEGDSIHVAVRHNMRRDILEGISDIGLIIEKTEQ